MKEGDKIEGWGGGGSSEKISGKLDKLKNLVFFLEKRITLVQDQIRIIGQTYINRIQVAVYFQTPLT